MTSKMCSKCNLNLCKDQKRGGYCTECKRQYGRDNYRANKQRYFEQAKKRDKQLDEFINSYKSKPCTDCGKKYPPYVMDLDHINPSNKHMKVSSMRRKRMSFETIKQEIEKCEVICANCHRERTNKQNPARYSKIDQKSP